MEVKTIIINGVEDVEIIKETIDETKIGPYQVFIENYISQISPGTELSRVYGIKQNATYPVRPGYCSVGKVLGKGEFITSVDVGDFVLYSGNHSSHHLYDRRGNIDGGLLYKLNPALPLDQAPCLAMCAIAMNGILAAEVRITDKVAIFGLGVLGYVLSILYHEAGVKVIGVDPVRVRADKLPLDLYIDNPQEATEKIMAFTDGKGVDIAVDASGTSQGICAAVEVTRKYGQVILLGSPRAPYHTDITLTLNAIHMKMLTVQGALNDIFPFEETKGLRVNVKKSLDYLSELVLNKKIDTANIISHVISPEEVFTAYQGLMHDKANYTGVLIDWKR